MRGAILGYALPEQCQADRCQPDQLNQECFGHAKSLGASFVEMRRPGSFRLGRRW